MSEEKKIIPKTKPEPQARAKVGRLSMPELETLRKHLEAENQAGSVRHRHVMEEIGRRCPPAIPKKVPAAKDACEISGNRWNIRGKK